MDFVLWFMGSNKIQIVQFLLKESIQRSNYDSGLAPNRLIKAFLKKAVNFERISLRYIKINIYNHIKKKR
jgi:hypothetical protein